MKAILTSRTSPSKSASLHLDLDPSSTVFRADPVASDDASTGLESADNDVKLPDSPRQHTLSIPSDATPTETRLEGSTDLKNMKGNKSLSSRARRGSATMRSFLQRVIRSQSDGHIRITPISQSQSNTVESRNTEFVCEESSNAHAPGSTIGCTAVDGDGSGRAGDDDDDEEEENDDDDVVNTFNEDDLVGRQQPLIPQSNHDSRGLCDVFLNSSLQLLQVQSDTKQRVRQLWACAQRLRWESQLSDSGLELLHQELLNVMKALTVEKLDGTRNIKSGYLTLIQAPAVVATNFMQRGAAAATKSLLFGGPRASLGQRVRVNLSEEQCRMELVPARTEDPPPMSPHPVSNGAVGQQINGTATLPVIGKIKLPTSISWLLSDPMHQQKEDESCWVGKTVIKLQGSQARRIPLISSSAVQTEPQRARFQLLVPNSDPTTISMPFTSMIAVSPEQSTPASSFYGVYIFELPVSEGSLAADQECDEWISAIERVCASHLYVLESRLREATYMLQFREVLATRFPVCISLTWLRNRLEKMPTALTAASVTAQQQAAFQFQQQQRRSSRNLSMVQIVKDLERDRILVDKKLLITCMRRQPFRPKESLVETTTLCEGNVVTEHDSVAEIVKYLVGKAMSFARRTGQAKPTPQNDKPPLSASSFSTDGLGPTSPSSRLANFSEARALAFVERVLRGSSRTQTGGDIYDAISFFCQHRNLTICPMSHDAHPVQLNVIENEIDGLFHIEIEVSMQFKVVEMPSMVAGADNFADALASPRDWAVIQGTLVRQFTLGKLSEPGTVTLAFVPDLDSPDHIPSQTVQ